MTGNDDSHNHDTGSGARRSVGDQARDVGRTVRLIIIALLVAIIVIVALDNTKKVRIGYAVGETKAPVWIVLVAAAIGGIVIGWLFKHRPRHRN